jgi:hypothetical protein
LSQIQSEVTIAISNDRRLTFVWLTKLKLAIIVANALSKVDISGDPVLSIMQISA